MTIEILCGVSMLINLHNWFTAKDGNLYKQIWGTCRIIASKQILGFEPRQTANWVLQMGTDKKDTVFILGCQVVYAQLCPEKPKMGSCYYVK